jgi:hypothetical protein
VLVIAVVGLCDPLGCALSQPGHAAVTKGSAMTLSSTEVSAPPAANNNGRDILADCVEQHQFARIHHITPRTVARYRNRADGLPWLAFGGRIYIPVREASDWLKAQVRHPNKRRSAA